MQAKVSAAISAGVRGVFGLRAFDVPPLIAASMIRGSMRAALRLFCVGCALVARPASRRPP
jgi:hypothetical protein